MLAAAVARSRVERALRELVEEAFAAVPQKLVTVLVVAVIVLEPGIRL